MNGIFLQLKEAIERNSDLSVSSTLLACLTFVMYVGNEISKLRL